MSTPPTTTIIEEEQTLVPPKKIVNFVKVIRENELGARANRHLSIFPTKTHATQHAIKRLRLEHSLDTSSWVRCINLSSDGNLLMCGESDGTVSVWNWNDQERLMHFHTGHNGYVSQAKWFGVIDTAHVITAGKDGFVKLFMLGSRGMRYSRSLTRHYGSVTNITASPDVLSIFYSTGMDGWVLLHDMRTSTSKKILDLSDDLGEIYDLAFHPSGREFVVGGDHGKIQGYDVRNTNRMLFECKCTQEINESYVTSLCYNRNGEEFLGTFSDSIRLFQQRNGTLQCVSTYYGVKNERNKKDTRFFGSESDYIVSSSDCGNIFIWDKHSLDPLIYLKTNSSEKSVSLEVHPELPYIFTGSRELKLNMWMPTSEDVFSNVTKLLHVVNWNVLLNKIYLRRLRCNEAAMNAIL